MGYELRDHTADVAVEATGPTLGAAFAAAADGMAAAMCDEIPPAGGEEFAVEVRAESREALLFDYLDELIYQRDVRGVLPVNNEVEVRIEGRVENEGGTAQNSEEWTLTGNARGVPLAGLGARDLKAVTYSDMDLRETDDGWRAYVVFDV